MAATAFGRSRRRSDIHPVNRCSGCAYGTRGAVASKRRSRLGEFVERCVPYFDGEGRIIDQPFQPRLVDGMVRCYLVHDRVVGFGEQLINMLFPAPPGASPNEAPLPGPRLYYPPTRSDFQCVETQAGVGMGAGTLSQVRRRPRDDLPAIWDADFLYGPKTASGEDTYVLCEINVSAVLPFPDSALEPLADAIVARLRRRKMAGSNG